MADPNLNHHTFGFYEDDSSDPDTCTIIGSINSLTETWTLDTNLMVRIGLEETANKSGDPTLQLECQVNGTGGWSGVSTSSSDARLFDGTPSEAAVTNSRILTAGATGSFIDGFYKDSGNFYELQTVSKEDFFELQWCVQLRSFDLSVDDYVEFRVKRYTGDSITFAYELIPKITVASAAASIAFSNFRRRLQPLLVR
jgi:hypothetical protein